MQRSVCRVAGFFLFVLSIAVFSLSAVAQDRIVAAIANGKVSALPGTLHPLARAEYDQGAIDGSQTLHGMSLDFAPSEAQETALAALTKAQQDPSSPNYHRWLTPTQYADQFGMTQSDIDKTAAWLQSQGFTVEKIAESRNTIWFSGTAAAAESAFHTPIHKYVVNGESHFANASAVSVPTALATSVVRVGGLNDFKLKPQLLRRLGKNSTAQRPQFTSGLSGSHYIAPGDFAVIYDLNALYAAGFTGAGQTIGVIGQTDIVTDDITNFRGAAGLPAYGTAGGPTFTSFLIPGSADPGIGYSGDLGEADLDIEWSGGVAKNANIVFVNSTDVFESLSYAIQNEIGGQQIPILTLSYAGCEAQQSTSTITTLETALQEAGVQGQTVINSAGDSGAAACDVSDTEIITAASQGLAVNYPASSAYVTGLGGTEFMGDGSAANPSTGADQYWSDNGSNDVLTSALSYIPEMAWNDTDYSLNLGQNGNGLSAGGGGVSALFAKPSWQTGVAGIPADRFRDVPDISLGASEYHDPFLICTQVVLNSSATNTYTSSCANSFRISDPGYDDDQDLTPVGGTSVSAPAFAGILAVIEQKLGTQLGNINPTLYTLAANSTNYASAFHDITTGNNQVPCVTGSTDCTSTGIIGYLAGPGYDQATGLGSVDANNLATAFSTVATKTGTTIALTASPTSPLVGATVTLTATISQNAASPTAPTGTVTFTVDGTALSAVTLAAGVATTTTSFSTGGVHTITAAYSGDAENYSSTGTATITAVATGAPSTTTVTATPASIALYGSVTLAATVQSTAGGTVAGTVTFSIGTTVLGTATITAGTSGTGTASLTVSSATTALGFTSPTTVITATYGG